MIVLAVILSSNGGLDTLINSFNDINELKNVSFWILFSIWAVIALLFLTMFLILFFFIKKLANQEESYTIFMFYAGYILIPAIIWYICCFLLSLELEMFSKQMLSVPSLFHQIHGNTVNPNRSGIIASVDPDFDRHVKYSGSGGEI